MHMVGDKSDKVTKIKQSEINYRFDALLTFHRQKSSKWHRLA
jgi:hypothetical protein